MAAYEEIAAALSYIFPDKHGNRNIRELRIEPGGDASAFFTWEAFQQSISDHYDQRTNFSPHNDSLREHVNGLNIRGNKAIVDVFWPSWTWCRAFQMSFISFHRAITTNW